MIRLLTIVVGLALLGFFETAPSYAKRKPIKPPELRILEVTLSPVPYLPSSGLLELAVEVELPAEVSETRVLEVSSLITSPSRHSLRFLVNRRSVGPSSPSVQASSAEGKPRVVVTLTWDGTDQRMQLVEKGRYSYEIRAKLLAVGENGPRTQTVSWPKRGVIDVK